MLGDPLWKRLGAHSRPGVRASRYLSSAAVAEYQLMEPIWPQSAQGLDDRIALPLQEIDAVRCQADVNALASAQCVKHAKVASRQSWRMEIQVVQVVFLRQVALRNQGCSEPPVTPQFSWCGRDMEPHFSRSSASHELPPSGYTHLPAHIAPDAIKLALCIRKMLMFNYRKYFSTASLNGPKRWFEAC